MKLDTKKIKSVFKRAIAEIKIYEPIINEINSCLKMKVSPGIKEKMRVINYNKRKIREINNMLKLGSITSRQATLLKKKHLINIHNERQYSLF